MAVRKTPGDYPLSNFRRDVAENRISSLYIFWGEETYLRDYYVSELVKKLADGDETSVRTLNGKECTPQALSDAVLSCPFLAERSLVLVRDVDILSPDAKLAAAAPEILGSIPDETCLVFICGEAEPGGSKQNKKIAEIFAARGQSVCFARPAADEFNRWIRRRFAALNKNCGSIEADYLASLCGGLMFAAIPEIEKVAAYARGEAITRKDIDAVVIPVSETVIFNLTDAVAARDINRAEAQLELLMKQKLRREEAITQLGAAMRRLYAARLTMDSGRGKNEYMTTFGVRSSYAADIHLRQARAFSAERLREAVRLCAQAEQKGFFGRLNDRVELDSLIYSLCGTERHG
ncbi:MAG: DNA polymerase III subunit delta [Clostridia bacterium]|nr:DNA polymerase III subunit delta [Clostridia bacterium]